ncbi:MAG: ribonuclease E/G [Stappia sp.]|uniref:ribonuclease E/G n=1 Tax=Stappia sp. TaxID=1870903 RepID=UPI000C64F698|nr:ribonuclease E/G [Stappia sp.]MAA98969.1 ribonuclease E/G [Stappia sp.]MBM18998.1 ribonuclease E/G [Stappia sp.]
MANKMLIDAAHPEETRVVVVRGNRVEEFDFEAANRKQLRGNIYLAKVTRVEPSLQAAFVDYGGNRHGFLAFSEIHPDYYQIPMADRQALLDEEEEEARTGEDDERPARGKRGKAARNEDESEAKSAPAEDAENGDDDGEVAEGQDVESVGAEDALEEVPQRARKSRKQYKIQEVIKRRQVLLVQVVKEERGNKGAALTTYLSLAGRYSVLMPNTARGGGISRKITTPTDRKRLKKIASELEVPQGMGVILRTAGASRTKAEIKRDFEYLMRLWENVRDLTLQSSAPYLVYEEGSLIKRSIRDLYNKDIDQVLVAGDEGYREAKDFMRMLMPSHAKNVQPYKDATPVFSRFMVESQLDAMFSPQVTLKSGGYIVINQTEALVAIDVNSGKSTREHNIEDTAVQTNLEAAEEVARQLRLRDLAGLIVIDFIDMEENKNNRAVERKLKDCLKNDRARIQVGRISHFGLLEMSRQRIRTGVLESSMTPCPHCHGTGMIRSVESVALHVLRSLEDHLLKGATHHLTVRTTTEAALYILNQKRAHLNDLENRFGLEITVVAGTMDNGHLYAVERGEPVGERSVDEAPRSVQPSTVEPVVVADDEPEEREERDDRDEARAGDDDGGNRKRRRRRRRRKPSNGDDAQGRDGDDNGSDDRDDAGSDDTDADNDGEARSADGDGESDDDRAARRKRRRGRRGGRRGKRDGQGENQNEDQSDAQAGEETADQSSQEQSSQESASGTAPAEVQAEAASAPETTALPEAAASEDQSDVTSSGSADAEAAPEEASSGSEAETPAAEAVEETSEAVAAEESDVSRDSDGETVAEAEVETAAEDKSDADTDAQGEDKPVEAAAPSEPVVVSETVSKTGETAPADEAGPKRSGWWQRRSFF